MTSRTTVLFAAAAAAAFPTAASAASLPVGGGVIVIKPVRGFETRLARAGTHLAALQPAVHRLGVYALAVSGGQFTFTGGGGTVANRGSLRLRRGRRTVLITGLSLTLGATSKVSAVVGGRTMTLFAVSRDRAHAVGTSLGRIITGLRLRFTSAAAARVDALLGSTALGARGVSAVASVLVEAEAGSGGASSPSASSPSPSPSGPNSGAPAGQPSSGATTLPGILGELGIPGLPTLPGLPGPSDPPLPSVPNLPLPGLPGIPTLP